MNLSAESGGDGAPIESEHKVAPLGQVCSILNGFAFKSEEYVENEKGLRIIRIANVQKGNIVDQAPRFYPPDRAAEFQRYNLSEGDLLLSLTGNVGRVGRIPKEMLPALLNQRVAKIIPDSTQIDPAFLFHLLNEDRFEQEARSSATGTAQQNLSTRWVETYEILLPPLEEQRRIVAEIEGYRKIIDGARQILAGYTPGFETRSVWPTMALSEVASFTSGGTPPKSNPAYWSGSTPWISAKDMKSPRLSNAALHISEIALRETATQLAPAGSILVLVRGMGLANGVPICELLAPCAFNQDIKAIHPNHSVDSAFLAAVLRREVSQFKAATGTAAHGTLKIESELLQGIRVPLPSLQEQRQIVAELEAEAAQMETVRCLIPRFEAKIQRILDRVWGNNEVE